MTAIREFAPAKINLTLEVAGRRPDGLHEIASLVAFASVGDTVTLETGNAGIDISGPFADKLAGQNILYRAAALIQACAPDFNPGTIKLEKALPVAAGIGGGSADAAALLRAAQTLLGSSNEIDWHDIAAKLGADVPACLSGRPVWMTGAGHDLAEVAGGLPVLKAILVNPLADVPGDKTVRVYRALGAAPLSDRYEPPPAPRFTDRNELIDFMRKRGNQLSGAAEAVVPEVRAVLDALHALPHIEHVAVSGGGPTCFAIFPDRRTAEAAITEIRARHPEWWAVAATLG